MTHPLPGPAAGGEQNAGSPSIHLALRHSHKTRRPKSFRGIWNEASWPSSPAASVTQLTFLRVQWLPSQSGKGSKSCFKGFQRADSGFFGCGRKLVLPSWLEPRECLEGCQLLSPVVGFDCS